MSIQKSPRIEYIDAMRGFTMILVVTAHVSAFALGFSQDPFHLNSVSLFCATFRMPLFFFISGFILYKAGKVWDMHNSMEFIRKKFMVQIIPAVIFFFSFLYLFSWGYKHCIYDAAKSGYWFTLILFYYFLAFIIMKAIQRGYTAVCVKCNIGNAVIKYGNAIIELFIIAFVLFLSIASKSGLINAETGALLSLPYLKYFIFFMFGYHSRQYFSTVTKLIDNSYITALVFVAFLSFSLVCLKSGIVATNLYYKAIFGFIAGAFGICCVFSFFYRYRESFTSEKKLGRTLQYIGRRTLDIYLLHYFFIPRNLHSLLPISDYPENFTFNFFVVLLVSAIVISFSLITSNFLRISPFLAKLLFGVKPKP